MGINPKCRYQKCIFACMGKAPDPLDPGPQSHGNVHDIVWGKALGPLDLEPQPRGKVGLGPQARSAMGPSHAIQHLTQPLLD